MVPGRFEISDLMTRGAFLTQSGMGMGAAALASLLRADSVSAVQKSVEGLTNTAPLTSAPLGKPHFAPRAKRIIFLFMAGGPSQLDLFDYKPALNAMDGKTIDPKELGEERFAQIRPRNRFKTPRLLASPYKFRQHGESGAYVSELLPHLAGVADEITFIKSMRTDPKLIDHPFAQLMLATGTQSEGRPSLGAWLSYGLGSENENLPAFIALFSNLFPRGGPGIIGSGFLPSKHQGVPIRSEGDPILFLSNPNGMSGDVRRRTVDVVNSLNAMHQQLVGDPEIASRIAAYEMACRMQTSAPELVDLSTEPKHILELYGAEPGKTSFANNCLLARRLIEKGVRMVQLVDLDWDHHGDTKLRDMMNALPQQCRSVDRAVAGLLQDLRQRSLLEETLVVWAAEFGRTPVLEDRGSGQFLGRDHHPFAATFWMAGGGVRQGMTYGTTDELGFQATENPVHIHDLQATILHLMGLNHERLTWRFQGREHRLTDVEGRVVQELFA
jgi:hypothetical protein